MLSGFVRIARICLWIFLFCFPPAPASGQDQMGEPEQQPVILLKVRTTTNQKVVGEISLESLESTLNGMPLEVRTAEGLLKLASEEIESLRWIKSRRGWIVGTTIGLFSGVLIGAVSYAVVQEPAGSSGIRDSEGSAAGYMVGWGLSLGVVGGVVGRSISTRRYPINGKAEALHKASANILTFYN